MNAVERLKTSVGTAWAVLCFLIVPATFVGLGFWSRTLANGTGIQVSPRFTGGEVRLSTDHGSYQTRLHRPVFDGLLGERRDGFVQIDWVPNNGQPLPALIEEEFDIEGDGIVEFRIRLDTTTPKADLFAKKAWVLSADAVITADKERILRVRLRHPRP